MQQTLANKRILLGISGGIAAYKSADLVRRLSERGADVRVILTDAAQQFITPLTLQAVSGNAVSTSLLDPSAEAAMGHIELAKWADIFIIAPASANLIAKLAQGMANDLLTTCVLATTADLFVAPAMNQQMYKNIATTKNIATLNEHNFHIIGPASGEQACGDVGLGRMVEPLQIVAAIEQFISAKQQPELSWQGITLSITAGPTREAIDPVRYISNQSSGKMGFALAAIAAQLGADVTLIAGPVPLATPAGVKRVDVISAEQMHQAALKAAQNSAIFIGCAAVADYRMAEIAVEKLKKTSDDALTLKLVKNPDIIASVAALSQQRPFTVGFAAETHNLIDYAKGKLTNKKLDMICANDVSDPAQGFNTEHNAVTMIWPNGELALPAQAKTELAKLILQQILQQYQMVEKAKLLV
ncbi:bifunctional phosphopantothenoylcysteine decarboxylase/phosphopantothenate--cysteine ligase CoaBC [Rheinheimera salexigens]|uniref:Coenzyme A biosynthesis bifunctional protein CoaBC n=1 Tax=Rheinheimera salexigens TaxID=1628148 RepID=A0A1E7Q9Q9_9GAMM|nr:bifunctional phosphopantothenoylcysteine decarboxylase/phosphopantothenate--cysteine ligase CoaBC [Rheinheimera salexigens]OEY70924.1 phosphopantothenoylcysteine decarboxylase [Rheinheimera salexigens]